MKDEVSTLSQILERIERIEGSAVTRDRFLNNSWYQDTVVRNLEVIGEAVKRLSETTRGKAPKIPWAQIAGFRDIAIHGYDRLDLERT